MGLQDCIESLKDISAHIRGDFESDNIYSLSAPRGSIVVFDPKGVHRGGCVNEGERFLIRVHCYEAAPLSWKSKVKRLILGRGNSIPFFSIGPDAGGRLSMAPVKEYG